MAKRPRQFQAVAAQQVNPMTQELSQRAQGLMQSAWARPTNYGPAPSDTPDPEAEARTGPDDGSRGAGGIDWNQASSSGNPGGLNDRELLARTLKAEAGNQGLNGMKAVGEVIANRARNGRWGNSIGEVIMAPGQFSAWNGVTGYANGEQGQDMLNMKASDIHYQAADAILNGSYKPQTNGALNYYANYVDPVWGRKAGGNWQAIGDHWFGTAR